MTQEELNKKAEEAAREVYTYTFQGMDDLIGLFFTAYEQAEKDTIERAIAWLKEHADEYIVDLTPTYPEAPVELVVGGMCWEHLKKYLEEER